jgi:hypothetical protein
MRLTKSDLEKVDLSELVGQAANASEFLGTRQHYKLLAYLGTQAAIETGLAGDIIDIGTHQGDSALALSWGDRPVKSFDVVDKMGWRKAWNTDIEYFLDVDLFDPRVREKWRSVLLTSPLIVIDIDPHEGAHEYELVRWLHENDYRGLIVLDDIWFFKQMRDNLWYRIKPEHKTDVTSLGHWSGTGIVSFNKRVELEDERDTSNWTLVTGYFDLTKKSDANAAIQARPAEHYIDQHGSSVLSLDKNLIVFCEPELKEKIWKMRPERLHARTLVVSTSFEDFPLTQYRSRIIENRGGPACARDPRNTASYYLFCMARYAMLKEAIDLNPFKSSHFAWINICIERMGFNNLIHLDEALGLNRDKFSTCWIDYVSKETVEDLPRYFGPSGCRSCVAGCTMCSGFFTGRSNYMRDVCDMLEAEFLRCLRLGFGHADEQLFPLVYYKNPELFDWYVGDYSEMITNYADVYEHPERPVRNLIRNSLAAGDHAVCKRACSIVLQSIETGKCAIDADSLELLSSAWESCS